MPYVSQYVDVDFDIDVEEFYDELSDTEVEKLIELLRRDNYLNYTNISVDEDNMLDKEYHANLSKLHGNRLNLTLEEEEIIRKIANKF